MFSQGLNSILPAIEFFADGFGLTPAWRRPTAFEFIDDVMTQGLTNRLISKVDTVVDENVPLRLLFPLNFDIEQKSKERKRERRWRRPEAPEADIIPYTPRTHISMSDALPHRAVT